LGEQGAGVVSGAASSGHGVRDGVMCFWLAAAVRQRRFGDTWRRRVEDDGGELVRAVRNLFEAKASDEARRDGRGRRRLGEQRHGGVQSFVRWRRSLPDTGIRAQRQATY
jgi:hypothetical protein